MQGSSPVFCPLPVDTLRDWSESMVIQVKRMCSVRARNLGGGVIRHLTQRVAVVLARMNAPYQRKKKACRP